MIDNYIYFDYAATTPLDDYVKKAASDFINNKNSYGNPGSNHRFGIKAKNIINTARSQVSSLINADINEIIFTSGASESINLVLKGLCINNSYKSNTKINNKKHIITSSIEHKATLNCIQSLVDYHNIEVTYLRPDKNGVISLDKINNAILENTILISLVHVNNEIGVIQDLEKLSDLAKKNNILLHMDAAQSLGRVKIDVKKHPVDFLSFSSHKIYGLKGVGGLYIRKNPRLKLTPLIDGGGQERGLRSGTLPTLNILSMGEACRVLQENWDSDREHITKLSKYFLDKISHNTKISLNCSNFNKVPDILSLSVGVDAEIVINSMPNIAFSAGSACGSGSLQPSHVLSNIGLSPKESQEVIRISFGRMSNLKEVDELASCLLNLY